MPVAVHGPDLLSQGAAILAAACLEEVVVTVGVQEAGPGAELHNDNGNLCAPRTFPDPTGGKETHVGTGNPRRIVVPESSVLELLEYPEGQGSLPLFGPWV